MPLDRLAPLLDQGVVVLDGAMGTELESYDVDTHVPLWGAAALISAPEAVAAVHDSYFAAGAQIATTDSYQASVPALADAGFDRDAALALIGESARLARQSAAERRRIHPGAVALVAGSIGPYGAYLADGSEYTGDYELTHAQVREFHEPRIRALVDAGVELFAIETQPRLDEARQIAQLVDELAPDAEAWVSFQVRPDGIRLADGTPLAEAAAWANTADGIVAVGVNCLAPDSVAPALAVLNDVATKPLVVYPNSGDAYDPVTKTWASAPTLRRFTAYAPGWLAGGVRLIGGCCRSTPADIATLAALTSG